MIEKCLIQIINKQIDSEFGENISMPDLKEKLIEFINDLIQNDFQKLIIILYKIDVDENKLKKLLKDNPEKDTAETIAKMIIERVGEKIKTRRQFEAKNETEKH